MELQVVTSDGWEKNFSFEKALIRIGSGFGSDIRISGNGISAIHFQIFLSIADDPKFILTALDKGVTLQRGIQEIKVIPMTNTELLSGDLICLGGYRMLLRETEDVKRMKESEHMRAGMKLSSETLEINQPITGSVTLENLGTTAACQFELSVDGIPSECIEIGPMPLLHPGNKSSVSFTITHMGTIPEPGLHRVVFKVSAANQYGGESIVFPVGFYTLPHVESVFSLEDDMQKLLIPIAEEENTDQVPTEEPVFESLFEKKEIPASILGTDEKIKKSNEFNDKNDGKPEQAFGLKLESEESLSQDLFTDAVEVEKEHFEAAAQTIDDSTVLALEEEKAELDVDDDEETEFLENKAILFPIIPSESLKADEVKEPECRKVGAVTDDQTRFSGVFDQMDEGTSPSDLDSQGDTDGVPSPMNGIYPIGETMPWGEVETRAEEEEKFSGVSLETMADVVPMDEGMPEEEPTESGIKPQIVVFGNKDADAFDDLPEKSDGDEELAKPVVVLRYGGADDFD